MVARNLPAGPTEPATKLLGRVNPGLVDVTNDPAEILAGLNRRLHGRLNNGFATCLALRFDSEGGCELANAGHPAPFLNQDEMTLPNALPLGIDPDANYERSAFRLAVGDRFTFYTPQSCDPEESESSDK